MVSNPNKFLLNTDFPIDKIVYSSDIISITNPGPTSPSELANIVTHDIVNPVGKRVFLKFKWSLDNANWETGNSHIWFSFTRITPGGDFAAAGLKGAVSVGIDADNVYIRTASGYHGDTTYNPDPSFSPISQTFYIKYWLYEV